MGAVIGLLFGSGLLLIWSAWTDPTGPGNERRVSSWFAVREERLRQAGITTVSGAQVVGAQLIVALLCGTTALAFTGTVAIAGVLAAFGSFLPGVLVNRLRRRRQRALREVWPEVVDLLASAVRAGMSLPDGVAALATRGPAQLRPAFARFASGYRTSGRFGDCLDDLKTELADPIGDRVCETLRFARDVGGTDLGAVLRSLAELLRAQGRARSELETRQGWVVNAARLAVAAPWLVLVLLGSDSETLSVYDSPQGVTVLLLGAAACIGAYRLMTRIAQLPADPRVLR